MQVSGFSLRRIADGSEVSRWIAVPDRIDLPEGDAVFGAAAGWSNGTYEIVVASWTEPDPPAQRRLISKALVLSRITDAQLTQALLLMTARQRERWRMPGAPEVYADDADLLQLLQAVGADPAVVLA